VALREAIANAVAHRDYSSYVRGTPIDIRMLADRLEVRSPGGLFGNVMLDNIEGEHSTRNARLMRMMEDLHMVENRGSGIKAMAGALRQANLEPPTFADRRSSFWVAFRNHTLMSPEAIRWLTQFAALPLNDRQRVALVYLRQHDRITNADYRRLNRVEAAVAGQELRGLVDADLVEQDGIGRWTTYSLSVAKELPEQHQPVTQEDRILSYVREKGSITSQECQQLIGVGADRAYYLLGSSGSCVLLPPGRWERGTARSPRKAAYAPRRPRRKGLRVHPTAWPADFPFRQGEEQPGEGNVSPAWAPPRSLFLRGRPGPTRGQTDHMATWPKYAKTG
jgi:ATP-dependent DNA helicase RecG